MDAIFQRLAASPDQIAEFCRRHHIKRLAFFGSIVRGDHRPDSDIDVMYEFESDHHPAWEIVGIFDELATMLGRKVDFIPFGEIRNPYRRRSIMKDHRVVYAA